VEEAFGLFRSILKAGVTIVTREPERYYSRENSGNTLNRLEPLFIMPRGGTKNRRQNRCVYGKFRTGRKTSPGQRANR
jgi:hypothetical protein